MKAKTQETRRKAGGPRTSNTGASNTSTRGPSTQVVSSDGVGSESATGLRVLHAGVDSVLATANFLMKFTVRRDLERAQCLAARAAGQETPAPVDAETGLQLDLDTWDILRPLRDADLWEALRDDAGDQVVIPIAGINWRVEGYGHGGYRWFMRSEAGDLWLNPEKTRTRPVARVRLSPEWIAAHGPEDAWLRVRRALVELAVEPDARSMIEDRVQRLDIKVDFLGAAWLGSVTVLDRMVTRATKSKWYSLPYEGRLPPPEDVGVVTKTGALPAQAFRLGKRETGWTLGSKDNIQMGAYDKTFEIGSRLGAVPTWQRELWTTAGGPLPVSALDASAPSDQHVWRLELRLSGDAMRSFRVRRTRGVPRHRLESVSEALACVSDLWRYGTEGWVRVVDRTATRLERCPTSEVWEALSEWPRGYGPEGQATFAEGPRVYVSRAQAGVAKAQQTTSALLGSMSSLLAAIGPQEALAFARKAMPDASAFEAVAWLTSCMVKRYARKKAVSDVADRLFGDAVAKEARLSVLGGNHPTGKLVEMVRVAAQQVSQEDAEAVLAQKIKETQKERARRQKKELQNVFADCDLDDPVIRAAYDKLVEQQQRTNAEMREMVDQTIRELFGLEEGADVSAFLLDTKAAG